VNGDDVLRDREELRPRVEPFLEPGESLDVAIRASSRPAKVVKLVAMEAWPFFHEKDKFLLVATDRRWLVLESAQERFEGALHVRGVFDRAIRLETSWLTRFDRFDQPYAVDPIYELWAAAANEALDTRAAGQPWDLQVAAGGLTAADNDGVTEALGDLATKVGRFVPRRRKNEHES
jgi:hypothetical protein